MLFDRLKKKLIAEEKIIDSNRNALPSEGEQENVYQNNKRKRISKLTAREHDLFLLLLEGFTLKESANRLLIKYPTANTHMTGIYKKLGVKSRAELIINYRDFNGGNYDE